MVNKWINIDEVNKIADVFDRCKDEISEPYYRGAMKALEIVKRWAEERADDEQDV